MIRQPNRIKISTRTQRIQKIVYGLPTNEFIEKEVDVFWIATKNKEKIKFYKKIRDWLNRAIEYGEQT